MAQNSGGFLGGGPQFNRVGASVTDDGTPEAVVPPTESMQPYKVRNLVIVLVILIMVGALFFISDPGGVIHKGGNHSAQPLQDQPAPPKNF